MGRRHRRDDLGELALERLRDALLGASPEAQVERERIRAARRAARSRQARYNLLAVGVGLLVGGLAAGVMPTVAAVGLAILLAGLVSMVAPALFERAGRRAAGRVRAFETPRVLGDRIGAARQALAVKIIEEAAEEVRRLEAAMPRLSDAGDAAIVARLAASGRRLIEAVAAAPEKIPAAQRVLTHHLAKAAYLAARLAEATGEESGDLRLTLARMDNLFEKVELDLRADEARNMALEVRLINQSLDEELGRGALEKGA